MATYLSGGGRTYALELEIVKSPPTCSRTSQTSSSPSSTLSESGSGNSLLAISTRKPRTPRKRHNQTYDEAAAILSTAYPNLFSAESLAKPWKSTKPCDFFFHESPELLLPCRVVDEAGFTLRTRPDKADSLIGPRGKCLQGSGEVDSHSSCREDLGAEPLEDFDAESILDEEIEEGIDSIMGNPSVDKGGGEIQTKPVFPWNGNYPMGLGFGGNSEFGLGLRRGVRALRGVEEGNWWNFPTVVNVLQINSNAEKNNKKKKKKKKKVEKAAAVASRNSKAAAAIASRNSEAPNTSKQNNKLLLKLDYDKVLKAWSDGGSPFADQAPGSDVPRTDISARLAQIDLLWDGEGLREASVLRYKEKRRSRLFTKKIRYQVRKVNADLRPRMKGRFVRKSSPNTSDDGG